MPEGELKDLLKSGKDILIKGATYLYEAKIWSQQIL